ncbi:filamentous hemagglutinin N-terminal domain-containing protein [Calothrix sp. FACHB-156]|nr:filamentous hemagglutinin N-terminal domain-containing protein [Calothrix sp. FACHB-156]
MNQIQNWLQGNCVLVKRRTIKRSKCDRTSFQNGFWRIFAMIIGQPKLILCSLILLSSAPAYSQINPDNTLGAESSRITPNVLINGANADKIDGGAVRGSNLFHSFSEFNINDGQRVYFGNPAGVQNILTRVTGGQASNILGTLGVDGNANLFLINPNGILFGQNARLDIRGSFVGTTANAVQLGNQGIFSATNPEAPPLLTVNPSALLFNQINPKAITNQSQATAGISPAGENITGLRVADNQNLLLIGGNINLDGGGLRAYGGNIELAAMDAPATVGLNIAANNLPSLAIPDGVERADVSLSNGAEVNVRGADGGNIKINGRNVNLTGDSKLRAGIEIGLGTVNSQSGDVVINATGTTNLTDKSIISNSVRERAFGKSGDVNITTGSLNLDKEALINVSTIGQGDAGSVFIQAKDTVLLTDGTGIYSSVEQGAVGNGGSIEIKAGSLSILKGSEINTRTVGQGNGGKIAINANETISVDGFGNDNKIFSRIISSVNPSGTGNAEDIQIKTGSLSVTSGAFISSSTLGQGNAGNIIIDARENVLFDRASAFSGVGNQALGNAGNIYIKAGLVSLKNNTYLSASTSGRGNAGIININASNSIFFDNRSYAYSLTTTEGVGKSGNVNINARSLSLKNGSQLSASTFGQGDAGNVTINASDTVNFDGVASAAFSIADTGAVGKAGTINITTNSLFVTNNAGLYSSTNARGDAGNVNISASNIAFFDVGSQVFALVNSRGVGKAGRININTEKLSVNNASQLSVSSFGQGNAGNVTINATDRVNFDGAASGAFSISGTGAVGKGGGINISTGSLFVTNGAFLTASTLGIGDAGTVDIDARDRVVFDGVGSNRLNSAVRSVVLPGSVGNGGEIRINTKSLYITNDAELTTSTSGKGNAGNITINANDIVYLDKNGRISSVVGATGKGKGGDINITTGSLSVTDDGRISTSTSGEGNAGNVFIQAKDSASFLNGFIFSSIESGGLGKGGEINVTANSLSLANGSQFVATSRGLFANVEITLAGKPSIDAFEFISNSLKAGNIQINATDSVKISGFNSITGSSSGLFTDTVTSGNSGNITVNTDVFRIYDSALLDARTNNFGDSGNITVNARIVEALNGGQLVTSTTRGGNAGKIIVNAKDQVIISDTYINPDNTEAPLPKRFPKDDASSGFFVSSSGSGTTGDIEVNSPKITLDNQGKLNADSASGNGGNINLNSDLLLLRRNSQISTNAGTEEKGGDGGNINLNSKFIVAVLNENSDISANAFTGKGGNVNISTQAIFGIAARPQQTNQSDITASSELGVQGEIIFTEPQVQTPQKLIELPTGLVDATTKFAQTCPRGPNAKPLGSFVVTGRGNLPPHVLEPLALTTSLSPLASLDGENADTKLQRVVETDAETRVKEDLGNSSQIVEAQGLVKTADGNIMLVAEAPTATPAATSSSAMCPKS